MVKYKSAVTDYEGMQSLLDAHASQGWRLFSVSADTWRKSVTPEGDDQPQFNPLGAPGRSALEYSASYYLVIFERDEYHESHELAATAEESLAMPPRHFYEE
ncbi:MAG: hypothetical protein ACLQVD_18790 [Capsulimonadaceae bacterium]